jgi:FKBP-type peptidyl-prolyl cis-trans isomerase
MERMNTILKVFALILFAGVIATGCNKNEDPYASYTPAREAALIKAWLEGMVEKKLNIDTTTTGIYYVPDKVGTGPTVKSGDKVTVKYTGMFLDGTVFDDSSYHGGTMTYVHKTDPLIQGWEEGIEVLSKGGSAAFLIPSAKGYGASGYSTIPPYQPLIFIIEVVDIQ